mmetsp:Transcript_25343/g.25568  ORF Transcript_25343/g.25568 Transcript_25343/m.25568 type:complete len:573 (+) Transcript_25343:274-1992(+)|eukprot:CAMPEP_0182433092 /NCGR_PEP_ID=MMETSP1167-20130531/60858_1 /TAXON_ID=2988 /ORGANISM="Mallomonas Sp, Strain CCMP3275" /LENGTH=572 /DNA_ID=CAMNT_0024621357 /DNA_START=158 /DNA_END=1876 /DNA_ORIENTATION=+
MESSVDSYFATSDPNLVFELVELLGEGSYGAVYKGVHKVTGEELAIKIIPSEEDMTQLEQEIDFLQRLKSPYVVSFIEGYLYDMELWIVMEYCAAGSLSDLYEATKTPLNETQLRGVMAYCVLGLHHLHSNRSIHRDLKAGNILLTADGVAKLADFGVSAQLTNTMQKRKTVIGTPFWMAPEVIQETSYDDRADIWSLGITAIELCEGQPPHYNVHPMRAIFMIPMKPAPTLKDPAMWSAEMIDFIGRCLTKKMEERGTTKELLEHRWVLEDIHRIRQGRGLPALSQLVSDNMDLIKRMRVGDESLALPTVPDDNNRTLDRGGGGGAAMGNTAKRTPRSNDTFNVVNRQSTAVGRASSIRRIPAKDSSATRLNAPPPPPREIFTEEFPTAYAQSQQHSDTLATLRRDNNTNISGVPFHAESGVDTADFSVLTGSEKDFSVSGTMQTVQRNPDTQRSSNSDLKAALKYFRRAPSERSVPVNADTMASMASIGGPVGGPISAGLAPLNDTFNTTNTTEALGQQEIKRQLHDLERQFENEMEELRRAYNARRMQLVGALNKFPMDVRAAENRLPR